MSFSFEKSGREEPINSMLQRFMSSTAFMYAYCMYPDIRRSSFGQLNRRNGRNGGIFKTTDFAEAQQIEDSYHEKLSLDIFVMIDSSDNNWGQKFYSKT